jgi:hypothetical protein
LLKSMGKIVARRSQPGRLIVWKIIGTDGSFKNFDKNGRGGEIRTHDLLHPKQARIPGYATPRTIHWIAPARKSLCRQPLHFTTQKSILVERSGNNPARWAAKEEAA